MEGIRGESKQGIAYSPRQAEACFIVLKSTRTFFLPWTFTCLLYHCCSWQVISWFVLMWIFILTGLYFYSSIKVLKVYFFVCFFLTAVLIRLEEIRKWSCTVFLQLKKYAVIIILLFPLWKEFQGKAKKVKRKFYSFTSSWLVQSLTCETKKKYIIKA